MNYSGDDDYAFSQQIINGKHDGVQDFCFGLDLILDSLERLHESTVS